MDFREFYDICQVWWFEDFWQVHYNRKADLTREDVFDMCLLVARANPGCIIKFTSAAGYVLWLTNRKIACPFEPSMYQTCVSGSGGWFSHRMDGFDQERMIVQHSMSLQTGSYRLIFSPDYRYQHGMFHSLSASLGCHGLFNDPKEALQPSEGWELIRGSIPDGTTVRRFESVEKCWFTDDGPAPSEGPAKVTSSGVYEHGYISPDGRLCMTRLTRARRFEWCESVNDLDALGIHSHRLEHHREDGPCVVEHHAVKEIIVGNEQPIELIAGSQRAEWKWHGRDINQVRQDEFFRTNNIVVHDKNLHLRSPFTSEQDAVYWAMHQGR